jgi:hypothetical protein
MQDNLLEFMQILVRFQMDLEGLLTLLTIAEARGTGTTIHPLVMKKLAALHGELGTLLAPPGVAEQETVQKIIAAFSQADLPLNGFEERYCPYCSGEYDPSADDFWKHEKGCLILQARLLLRSKEQATLRLWKRALTNVPQAERSAERIEQKCMFHETVDLPPAFNGMRTQCPECGAYRTLKLAFQDGAVYYFPRHNKPAKHREKAAWKRIDNIWKWSDNA